MLVEFEQICVVRATPKFWSIFWQNVDVILENVSVVETNVWC